MQVLLLADDERDAELVGAALEHGLLPCELYPVFNHGDFLAALEREDIDIVLADLSLPGFDALSALHALRGKSPEVPCIVFSGLVGEEVAVECLKQGAADFLLKHRMTRLVPAIRRALAEAAQRPGRGHMVSKTMQAQKMEVLGQLAASLAHEFNNVLDMIFVCTDLWLAETPSHGQRHYAETIQLAAERAAALTRQLLIFSPKPAENLAVTDLNKIVLDMENTILRLVGEKAQLDLVLGEIGSIKANAGSVWQIVMDLAGNAVAAWPDGCKLTISTKNVTLSEDTREAAPGDYVLLSVSVSDPGTGITEAVKTSLFEPSLATQPNGKGTGLGLASYQTIAGRCSGLVSGRTEPGRCATFEVHFRRTDSCAEAAPSAANNLAVGGTATILIVEDEPALRCLARITLEQQGYRVLTAGHGLEGLQVVQQQKGAIQLVVTDVVMPKMGGIEMADTLRIVLPDLKILFTSGYPDDAITHNGIIDPGIEFLPKPYTPAELISRVRCLLLTDTQRNCPDQESKL